MVLNRVQKLFKRGKLAQSGKEAAGPALLYDAMPSWLTVLFAYVLLLAFWISANRIFPLLPPYAYDICKNLRGMPTAWADLALLWSEKGLKLIALLAVAYHQIWQLCTRYKMTSQAVHVESWFPRREATLLPFASIRKVSFRQSLLGLILNSGTVEIDTGGAGQPLTLDYCAKPAAFYKLLQSKIDHSNANI